jgi:Zn-dependent protease
MKIATIFGIPLYLHWSWFLFMAFVAFGGVDTFLLLLITFFFVTLHEYGHCLVAKYLNIDVHDVVLYPLGGIARMDINGENAREELLVAIAGPLVNIILFLLLVLIPLPSDEFFCEILVYSVWSNLALAAFNLLPLIPLDGGRVLRACLQGLLNDMERATTIAVRLGQIGALFLIALGIIHGMWMMVVILSLIAAGSQAELCQVRHQAQLKREIESQEVLDRHKNQLDQEREKRMGI